MKIRIISFVALFFACTWTMCAQNLRRITTQDGLSGSAVTSVCQSDDGLMWVGTLDGIDIFFGGKAIRPSLENFFKSEIIERIVDTDTSIMWVQTSHALHKINRIQEETQSFTRFSGLYVLRRVMNDRVAVLDVNSRFHIYDPSVQSFEELAFPLDEGEEIVDFGGTDDFLWIMGRKGIYRFRWIDSGEGKLSLGETLTLIDAPVKYCAITDNPDVIHVLDNGNRLWQLDVRQNVKTFVLKLDDDVDFRGQPSGIVEANGTYYISFKVHGVVKCAFDASVNSWVQSTLDIKSGVFQMVKDKYQNLVWIATDGQGLFSVWEGSYSFKSYLLSDFGHDFGKPVRAFFVDEKDWLWIGMKGEGLLGLDCGDGGENLYKCRRRHFTSSDSKLKDNSVYALSASRHGGFWVGTDAGLNFFRYSDRSLQPVYGGDDIIYVHSIHERDDSKLWIATVGAGVFEASIVNRGGAIYLEDVRHFELEHGNMSSNYFFAMRHGSDGSVWLGNRGEGIFHIAPGGDSLERFEPVPAPDANLLKDVFALQKFSNVLWAGTSRGLVGLGPNKETWHIDTDDGLPNSIIRSFLVDDNDGMWMATGNGLARLDSTFASVNSYGRNNGLLVTEFCDGAAFRAKEKLYFGGMNGWVEVRSNSNTRHQENFTTPLYFFDLKSPKTQVNLLNRHDGAEVKLEQGENNFIVRFIAMDHVAPDNYHYRYKLDSDNEGEWLDNGPLNHISLSKLPHGHYTLSVKYINLTTGEESAPASMDIVIAPYWWQTAGMKCLYWLILAIVLAYGVIWYNSRMKLKHINNLNALEQQHKEDLYEEKLRFITNITHEFCTPLTLIYSPCERILAHEGTDEFVRKYVKLIKKNANRLNNLIQEVIDYRRIETKHQQLHVQRSNLSEFMKETCELFVDLAEKNSLNFIREIEPEVCWNMDMRCLPNVVYNLLSNAVKYTPKEGTVKFSFARLSDEQIEIRVYNTGKGIREEDRQRIFDRYHILDNGEDRATAGLARNGLGMAICHSSVKLLGGTIGINSEVGEYAEFVVRLPMLPLSEADEQMEVKDVIPLYLQNVEQVKHHGSPLSGDEILANETSDTAGRGVSSILVVDDNADVLFLLKETLSHSYHVEVARSVDEALECLRASVPQLIITDVMMPGKDGMQLIRQIKQNKHTMHVPLVILSARNTIDDMTEGVQVGADAYIGKPFNAQYLLAMVERLIENRKDIQQYYNSSASAYSYVNGQLLKSEDKGFIYKMEEYIGAHLSDSNLDAEAIADAMNVSVRSLYRRLKELNYPSPNVYIKDRRMNKVVKLLKTSDLSIQEIIYECGFNNRAHFYKDFSLRYGMTPKEFRQSQKSSDDTLGEE